MNENKEISYSNQEIDSEMKKIDSLNLENIKSYLNDPDTFDYITINDKNKEQTQTQKKLIISKGLLNSNTINKKHKTRKRKFKFTYIKANKYKLRFCRSDKKDSIEREDALDEEDNIEIEDKDDKSDLNEYSIQGRTVYLSKSDYQRFISKGKWRSSEFFRFKPTDIESKCNFCGFKCKTKIEGYNMCVHCRLFAQKSLVKHHMFVCKDNEKSKNEYCQFKRLNDSSIQSDKIYCRYCHFHSIVNKLPSLNRLQNHLVQFINNRVIYVNSVSKKTMFWRSRLMHNSNNNEQKISKKLKSPKSVNLTEPKSVEKLNTSKQKLSKLNEKENDFGIKQQNHDSSLLNDSFTSSERKGPRVKHVSRAQPIYLNQIENKNSLLKNKNFSMTKYKFYNELKKINEDIHPVFINWQSFTSDLTADFTLSALPEKFKQSLMKTYDFQFHIETKLNSNNKSLSDDLISSELRSKNDLMQSDSQITDEGSNLSSNQLINSTHKRASTSSLAISKSRNKKSANANLKDHDNSNEYLKFDWDDYFDRHHKISSNQNFRLTSLNQQPKEAYIPKNMTCLSKTSSVVISNQETSNLDLNDKNQAISSKRFNFKLNSYKDKFQPFNLDTLNDRLKEAIKSNDFLLNDINNNNNQNKNFYSNLNDFSSINSSNSIINSNSNLNQSIITIPFPFVIPDYLVWDNNVVNKLNDISKTGFSVISYSPYCLKSSCYLCGSGADNENKLLYCSMCCEPYHNYCLYESERPRHDGLILNWLCPFCKYCEICYQQNDLHNCLKCGDSYHFDCLKKSNYPRKLTKKLKLWICFKCFECKICESKNIFYVKKVFSKMTNFDFRSCFKCYEKYQLEKPFKCCNLTFSEFNPESDEINFNKNFYECNKCNQWFHFNCLGINNEDLDLIRLNNLKFECYFCDNSLADLKNQIIETRIKIFQDLFKSIDQQIIDGFENKLEEYLQIIRSDSDKILSSFINEFYVNFVNEISNQSEKELKLKNDLNQILNEKYQFLISNLEILKEQKIESSEKELVKSEENITNNEISEDQNDLKPDQLNEQQNQSESINSFFSEDLIKCPHEDHTYAISSNSIAIALQTSDIINQKNFLEQIKEVQVNPTLQKIINTKLLTYQNYFPSKEKVIEKIPVLNEPKIDLNNLDAIKNFSNIKQNSTDFRECLACRLIGDDDICGRLIPFDGYWIHLNCLLWSDDVIIEDFIVEQILSVFHKTKSICCYCKRDGATISCYNKSCSLTYHFNCAYESKCYIGDDLSKILDKKLKTNSYFLYCPEHSANQNLEFNPDEIKNMNFKKMLYINLKDDAYRRKYSFPKFSLKPPKSNPYMMIGSLQIENLGDLETISDYKDFLCPINYSCSRLFWSTNEIGKKVIYKCRIVHIDDYKKEINNQKLNQQNESSQKTSLIDSNELKFYLDNFYEKEESLANLDTNLETISQLDGLNDHILNTQQNQQQTKNIIKFPNLNGGVTTLVQKFGNTTQLNVLNRPAQTSFNQITARNQLNEKPKVLKLESNLKCFSNIKIMRPVNQDNNNKTPLNVDTKPLDLNTFLNNTNKSFLFTGSSRQNETILSPRSDRSDSSLNLNHSSAILNPIQSSFEDFSSNQVTSHSSFNIQSISNENTPSTSTSLTSALENPSNSKYKKKDKSQPKPEKLKKPKVEKEKKPKRVKTDSISTKCTVAALLNQFHKQESSGSASSTDLSQPPLLSQSPIFNSLQNSPVKAQQEPILINQPIISSFQPIQLPQQGEIKASETSIVKKKYVSQKVKNKLRDYFKDELNSITSNQENIENKELGDNLVQKPEPNLLLKSLEAKILERKYKKKDISLKTKTKFNSGIEKKKIKLNKDFDIASSSGSLSTKQGKTSQLSIVNNQYNDLDLDNPNSACYRSQLVFEITCEDGLKVVSYDINKAWKVIIEKIKKLRQDYKLKIHSNKILNGARLYGLYTKAAIYMLEQLESIQFCPLYKTKYIHNQNSNDKWIINLNNCARTSKQYDGNKKCLDQFYWLASEHRNLNFLNLNQRFDQKFFQAVKSLQAADMCSSMKYRYLKDFSKNALVVKRSNIHGRGLFTLVDLNPSQMIIEYSGEIIRNELCDKREKFYESKGIGCYMFRIDEYEVIDATTRGNQARFINHSCDPNCISKVLVIQGQKHIVIFAQRFIGRGEELTYDYKFPKEDIKIKCLCKSNKCRKYLN